MFKYLQLISIKNELIMIENDMTENDMKLAVEKNRGQIVYRSPNPI